jgi:hypothetical protein
MSVNKNLSVKNAGPYEMTPSKAQGVLFEVRVSYGKRKYQSINFSFSECNAKGNNIFFPSAGLRTPIMSRATLKINTIFNDVTYSQNIQVYPL